MKVLHFSAEPMGEPNLALSAELRGIADALLPGRARQDTSLDVVPQARPSDVLCYLKNTRPDIVQFSSHGESSGLMLCDAYFDELEFTPQELRAALDGQGVKLLVLNCCESRHLAEWVMGRRLPPSAEKGQRQPSPDGQSLNLEKEKELLEGVVDAVIFTERKLPEDQAHVFSETLYRGLQTGMTIGDAFSVATGELDSNSRDIYRCEVRDEEFNSVVLLDHFGEVPASEPSDRQRALAASSRFSQARFGASSEARENLLKLSIYVGAALLASVVYKTACWEAGPGAWILSTFGWIKIDPWLIFTFFAAPPLLYLVEYIWLKRALTDAEQAAFWAALSPPPAEKESTIAERIEAMVAELDQAKAALSGEQKND